MALVVGAAGCAAGFGPVGGASWQAARLYASGTDALDRGEGSLAVLQLERAAALAPGASEIRNHLGLAYAAVGRPEAAQRAFEAALQLDCRNEAARSNLEWARERAVHSIEAPLARAHPTAERP